MHKVLLSAAALGAAAFAASPAQAATIFDLVDPDCSLTAGCLFNIVEGNLTESLESTLALEAEYNTDHIEPPFPATIDLSGLYKTPGSLASTSGTFTLPGGGLFDFFGIKAGQQFMLYQVSPTNTVDWTTAGLLNSNGQLRDASHIVAFSGTTAAVPEPSTWGLLLLGFGAAGFAMRRRKSNGSEASARITFA